MEDYSSLISIIQDAWNGQQTSLYTLQEGLRKYQNQIANPNEKKPNPQHLQQLKTKVIYLNDIKEPQNEVKFGDEMIPIFTELSSQLNLNELSVVELVVEASKKVAKRRPTNSSHQKKLLMKYSYELYFTRRHNLLVAILDLILISVYSKSFESDLVQVVNQFLDEIITSKNLINNLITLIKDIQNCNYSYIKAEHDREISYCLSILFSIYQLRPISWNKHGKEFLDLIRITSKLAGTKPSNHNNWAGYMLCFALYNGLNNNIDLVNHYYQQEAPNNDTSKLQEIHELIKGIQLFITNWHNEGISDPNSLQFIAIFYIIIALFFKRIQEALINSNEKIIDENWIIKLINQALTLQISKSTIENNGMLNIFQMMEENFTSKLQNESSQAYKQISKVLSNFFVNFFKYFSNNIEQMMISDEKFLDTYINVKRKKIQEKLYNDHIGYNLYDKNEEKNDIIANFHEEVSLPKSNFTSLLSIVSNIMKINPNAIEDFTHSHTFYNFLIKAQSENYSIGTSISIDIHSVLLPSFIELLSSLCCNNYGCQYVYDVLDHSQRFKLSWSTIFQHLDRQITRKLSLNTINTNMPQALHNNNQSYRYTNRFNEQQQQLHQQQQFIMQQEQRRQQEISLSVDHWSQYLMICLLKLVEYIIKSSEYKKILSQKQYSPIDKLFTLLSCPFSPVLKGQVFKTLSSFAYQSALITQEIWSKLDVAGVIPTKNHDQSINTTTTNSMLNQNDLLQQKKQQQVNNKVNYGGLYHEFDMEQRYGKYPITVSFLQLLVTLLSSSNFNWNNEKKILKYIEFVQNKVFNKIGHPSFYNSNDDYYDDDTKKNTTKLLIKTHDYWLIAEACMAIFVKITEKYDPSNAEAEYLSIKQSLNSTLNIESMNQISIGYQLFNKLLDIEQGQELFKPLLHILMRSFTILELPEGTLDKEIDNSWHKDNGHIKNIIQSCVYFALRFICTIMHKEELFVKNIQKASDGIRRLQYLRDLLLSTEEGQDITVSIAKAIGYFCELNNKTYMQSVMNENNTSFSSTLINNDEKLNERQEDNSKVAFYSAQLIRLLCIDANKSHLLVNILDHNTAGKAVCHAIAAQLENIVINSNQNQSKIFNNEQDRTRIAVIQLILSNISLKSSKYNFAHYVLGFDNKDDVSKSNLHRQIVNATDNISSRVQGRLVLDTLLSLAIKPSFSQQFPALAETIFELFYFMASNKHTSSPFLNFLNTEPSYEFLFFELLENLPIINTIEFNNQMNEDEEEQVAQLKVLYLLQRAHIMKSLALVLYKMARRFNNNNNVNEHGNMEMDSFREEALQRLGFLNNDDDISTISTYQQKYNTKSDRVHIFKLLDAIVTELPTKPKRNIPKEIQGISTKRLKINQDKYDVKHIYKLACDDPMIIDKEAYDIARAFLTLNNISLIKKSAAKAFDGWKQIVSVCVYSSLPPYLQNLDQDYYQSFCFQMAKKLLLLLCDMNPLWQSLGPGLSSVVLSLMATVREEEEEMVGEVVKVIFLHHNNKLKKHF